MKVKRIKQIRINSYLFRLEWINKEGGARFNYSEKVIEVYTKGKNEDEIFMVLCHEIFEIVAVEMHVRLQRPDCDGDYIFVYDHRQFETMTNMFAGIISQFVEAVK